MNTRKQTLGELIRYNMNDLVKMIDNKFTPAQIIRSLNLKATEAELVACAKRHGLIEESKKTKTLKKLKRRQMELKVQEFTSRRVKTPKPKPEQQLVSKKDWEKVKQYISKIYSTLSDFCKHKGFSQDEFELVFAMQPTKNWQKVLVAMEIEEMITARHIKRYINTVGKLEIDNEI
jgi:tRNA(Ile)-lysidine synthase TilS/MesJ